jgi:LuxR family transcriptional regulator, maltose regulon positive regulatory protein
MATPGRPAEPIRFWQTKLYRPSLGAGLLRRPRLESRLEWGLDRNLILVSAPAGFGKTTLVVQWLEARGYPTAWLSLHEDDANLITFLHLLIAAIRTLHADACPTTWAMLEALQEPPAEELAISLVNELCQVSQDFLLVLDDYHRVKSRPVHQLVETLVEHMPPSLHLVLSTRADPPLRLATMRAGEKMLEVRGGDLRFTPDEVEAYFEQFVGIEADPALLAALVQRTEGWIVGLRLAALWLRDGGELPVPARSFGGANRDVIEYLVAEVLSQQPNALQELLIRSSILERFCAPLLDALIDPDPDTGSRPLAGGGRQALKWMEQANLFLVPLDDKGIWFRYHHLFRELLQHRLLSEWSEELVACLHTRAADWFAARGLPEEALHHALAAGDAPRAARMVERQRHALLDGEDWYTLLRWVNLLPEELIHQRPGLVLARAWHQQWRWQYGTMPPLLERAEELLSRDIEGTTEGERQILRGEIDALWSALSFARGDGRRCLEYGQRAGERLPTALVYVRSTFFEYLGWGYQMTGQAQRGIHIVEEALASEEAREVLFTARMLLALAVIYYLSGDLRLQEQMASRLLRLTPEGSLALSRPWAYLIAGVACYQKNRLEEAATHFLAVTEHPYTANAATSHAAMLALALTYQAQGRPEAATQVAEESLEFALEIRHPRQMLESHAFRARLALLQSDLKVAQRWARDVTPEDLPARTLFPEVPRVTLARVLLAQATRDSLQEASQILEGMVGIARGVHSAPHTIELLALQALVAEAQGKGQEALHLLRQSLELAQPAGFLRVYVDLGPAMVPLLSRLAESESEPGYIRRILAAFAPAPAQGKRRRDPTAQLEMVEPLTNREQEILELLARRLSDKEIAQALHISPYTVSKHTSNLYGKLQAAGRRQAVSKARALGILPPEWA